ncbi:MAG TPA: hypothetical protein VJT73_09435, partial [Polyangiaceae bacterium]|nr:hypothetical protein [Polyangiaceae bacterium]
SPRCADHAWVHLREIASDLAFASIDANVTSPTEIDVKTERVIAFGLDRDPELLASKVAVRLKVDGTTLTFGLDAPIEAHRKGDAWAAGPKGELDGHKRRGLSGPIRDAFFEPLVFVYGTGDPKATQANREVAHAWARIRWGVDARFPIIADAEFDDALAETHSLVLVGNAEQNRVVRALEPHLPFRATQSAIVATNDQGPVHEWKGADLGVAFIYPNPEHASRYVLVIEGTSPLGTFRAIALPELLPDFMVYGDKIAAARGQILLGNATPLAAGLFNTDWSLGRLNLPQR